MRFLYTRRGLSLVEIVFVIAVIGLLASVVLANISEGKKKARDTERMNDIQQIQVALKMYRQVNSSPFPTDDGGNGEIIGDGEDIDDLISSYLTGVVSDPLSGTTGFGYYYDSAYDCTGSARPALIVQRMEQSNNANHEALCGEGVNIGIGVTPDLNSYIILLN